MGFHRFGLPRARRLGALKVRRERPTRCHRPAILLWTTIRKTVSTADALEAFRSETFTERLPRYTIRLRGLAALDTRANPSVHRTGNRRFPAKQINHQPRLARVISLCSPPRLPIQLILSIRSASLFFCQLIR